MIKLLVEAGIAVAEYLLNRARKPAPAVKHDAAKAQRDAWERKVKARQSI